MQKLGGNPSFKVENFPKPRANWGSFYNNPFSVSGIKSASHSEERNVYFSMAWNIRLVKGIVACVNRKNSLFLWNTIWIGRHWEYFKFPKEEWKRIPFCRKFVGKKNQEAIVYVYRFKIASFNFLHCKYIYDWALYCTK